MDDLHGLSRRPLQLFLGEPIQSLQHRLDIVLPQQLLCEFPCVMVRLG